MQACILAAAALFSNSAYFTFLIGRFPQAEYENNIEADLEQC
jgi:hypothetical protein